MMVKMYPFVMVSELSVKLWQTFNFGGLFKYFRHVLRQRVCRQPIRMSSGARAVGVFKCENQGYD